MTQDQKPAPTFDALALSADVRQAIDALGYQHPTPVQLAVFEPAKSGKSLVVQARTGTGKTAAFGLPIIDTLVKKSTPRVQALILVPTRELALQVARELAKIAEVRGTKVMSVYGGAPMGKQIDALADGAQVVVGTPGRVLDHLRRGTLDASQIRIFVLDEADEMLSMGFAKELHAIVEFLPKERQGLYFSATIPPDIERLANAQLKDPEYVTLSSDQVGALEVQHFVYITRAGEAKRQDLVKILEVEDPESAVIFCNTKDETEKVAEALKNKGFDAEWLNGDLEQKERERIMAKTREGKLRFLVATDVAARGIDISHLTHVINADFPENAESYVHRTGRTGRAGRTGTAISLVGPRDVGSLYLMRLTYKIRPIEKQLPSAGELKTRAETDLVQFFVDAFAQRRIEVADLSLARRLLTHVDAEKIVAGLLRDHIGGHEATGVNVKEDASDARRAKNPAPLHAIVRESTPPHTLREGNAPDRENAGNRDAGRNVSPRAESTHPSPRPARRASPSGSPEPRSRGGVRHAELAGWEPRAEADDDKPILPGVTVEGEGRIAPQASAAAPSARNRDRAPSPSRREIYDVPAETLAQIYVGVGRREGIRPSDVEQLFAEHAKIEKSALVAIRVRDRATFVSVKKEHVEAVVLHLHGIEYRGKNLVVERAREHSSPQGERANAGDAHKDADQPDKQNASRLRDGGDVRDAGDAGDAARGVEKRGDPA